MKNERYYIISEDTYHKHIDEEVHLYGLLHQLAFVAGKVKDAEDMESFQETAIRYGEIVDDMFEDWNIPGRYLVHGDKADLATLRKKELEPVDMDFEVVELDDEGEDGEYDCLRDALEAYLCRLEGMADIIAEAIEELDALAGE